MTVLRRSEANKTYGVSRTRHALKSGRWQRPTRGVLVDHSGSLTAEERDLVALLSGGPAAVLAGPTALQYDGFKGFPAGIPHVTVADGARQPSDTEATVHWSTMLDERDVHPLRSPRRTRPARSVCDFASWCGSDRYARVIVLAAFQQRLVNVRQMRDALSRRGPCKRRSLIIESVLDARGGIQSLPEFDFGVLCQQAGFPKPSRQSVKCRKDGKFYLDVEWEEYGLAVEIHGIPHMNIGKWDADLMRNNEIVIEGPRLLIFTSYAIRHEPDLVTNQLCRALIRADWIPTT